MPSQSKRPIGHRQRAYLEHLLDGPQSIQALRMATGLIYHRTGRGYRPMHTLAARGLVVATEERDEHRGQKWAITPAGREELDR